MPKRTKKQKKRQAQLKLLLVACACGVLGSFIVFRSFADTSVTNPVLPQTCGLDIALVLDLSNSIDSSELAQMNSAMTAFTNAIGGTSTDFAVIKFASSASIVQPFTSNITLVNSAIGASFPRGSTNTQDGLVKAQAAFDPRPTRPNLIILATDGQPNTGAPPGVDLANAVSAANDIKAAGIRIEAVYINDAVHRRSNYDVTRDGGIQNLEQISGPNIDTGSVATSDIITSSFDTLATDLGTFAQQTCGVPAPGPGPSAGPGPGSGSGGGSTATQVAQQPQSIPTPSPQGEAQQQPTIDPSPFLDGKQYAPGSEADTSVSVATKKASTTAKSVPYAAGGLLIIVAVGAGIFLWRRKK